MIFLPSFDKLGFFMLHNSKNWQKIAKNRKKIAKNRKNYQNGTRISQRNQ